MDTLPPQTILTGIYPYLGNEDIGSLSLVCQQTQGAFSLFRQTNKYYEAGNYRLKPCQGYIRDIMLSKPQHVIFTAPMSYGKTATGLSVPFHEWIPGKVKSSLLWLIIVPPQAIDTWEKEAIKMYGKLIYQSKSSDSPLLIPSKSKTHRLITKDTLSTQTQAILLSMFVRTDISIYGDKFNVIFDESHKKHKLVQSISPECSSLLLSASNTNPKIEEIKFRKISVPQACVKMNIPKPRFQILTTSEVQEQFSKNEEQKLDWNEYYPLIHTTLISNTQRVAIFCPGPCVADLIGLVNHHLPSRQVFKFTKSTNLIARFEQNPSGILVIKHVASEAININTECLIVIRGDWVNKERINQLIGRAMRTTNPNKYVDIYHIVPHGLPRLRTLYTDACYYYGIHMDPEVSMSERLISSFRLMYLTDPTLASTTHADMVALVNLNGDSPDEMYEWWKNKPSGYEDEMKKKILYLPFYQV